jgi:hypothetical protein
MGKHDYNATGVAADSTGVTHVSFVGAHLYGSSATVEQVIAEQSGAADADFNVELDGNDVFSNEQSLDAADTPEELTPDQNKNAAGSPLELAVDVSSASGTADSTLDVTVVVDDGKED